MAKEQSVSMFNTLIKYFGAFEYGIHKDATEFNNTWLISAGKFIYGLDEEAQTDFADYNKLRKANVNGLNIFMRPLLEREPYYLLLDDVTEVDMQKHKQKIGRLIIQTSENNCQIWIKSDRALDVEEKKYWIKFFKADTGASPKRRWGRAPDFRNYKPNRTEHPWCRIIACTIGTAQIPVIEQLVKQEQNIIKSVRVQQQQIKSINKISRIDYDRGNESATDYAYALALIVRGATDEQIKDRLLTERNDFHRTEFHRNKYIERTIKSAREYAGVG